MKAILSLVIAVSLLGFIAFYKYSSTRCGKLQAQVEIEREKNDELQKKFRLLEQKMQLEEIRLQELITKIAEFEKKERMAKALNESRRLEEEKNKRQQLLADKEEELRKLKQQLDNISASPAARTINAAALAKRINAVKSKINHRTRELQKIDQLVGNIRFVCFDMCINGTDIKFERKMTRTCQTTVSGGIYFCEHYDMTGNDYCTHHNRHHKNWKFPNRYRDDHTTAVRYLCRAHKIVWDRNSADTYYATHRNSRAILGNRIKYRSEIKNLQNELSRRELEYASILKRNKNIESLNRRAADSVQNKKNELSGKIETLENEIAELKN